MGFIRVCCYLRIFLLCTITVILVCLCGIASSEAAEFVWRGQFDSIEHALGGAHDCWGQENLTFNFDKDINSKYMRVFIPKGSIDPASMKTLGLRRGGAGLKISVLPAGVTRAVLTYRVRFARNFDFVKGGKLPGLFGGLGNSGGFIPNGADGFSFRLMWGAFGMGCVYAYLPTSVKYGTPLLYRKLRFVRGSWQTVTQEVILNHPGKADGVVRMWIDGKLIGEETGILVRTVDTLTIDGLFFDVFFGGNDSSWASTRDTYIDFSDFVIRAFTE